MDVRTPGTGSRVDHLLIADMVKPGARVLDIGCDTGDLLKLLETARAWTGAAWRSASRG